MYEKSAFTFNHNFYPKSKVVVEDATLSNAAKNKLEVLKQNYNDIVSQQSSDIGLTHLEEMIIKTDPELPELASKLYPLPLKDHKFIKEEIENLLQAGNIERLMNPYAAPIIVLSRKSKPGAPLV